MASRKIADCHPDLQRLVPKFLSACRDAKIEILVYCTYRSSEEQNELYKIGRTKPGKILTNAKGGQSKHNFTISGKPASKAFDFVPLVGGKPAWNDAKLYRRAGEIGETIGLKWAGRWTGRLKETAHMQID